LAERRGKIKRDFRPKYDNCDPSKQSGKLKAGRVTTGWLGKPETEVSDSMNLNLKLGAGALIVGAAITAAGCSNSGASSNMADAATASPARQNAEDKMPRINVQEAKKLIAEGKAVIIDVRAEDAYKTAHIEGANNVPLDKIETGNFKDLPKDKLIIAYCS
jgi:hypothetical protein